MKYPLAQLNRFIRWDDFRPINKAFAVTDPSLGGWPPFDGVMFSKY